MEKHRGVCILLALIFIFSSPIRGKEEEDEKYGEATAEMGVGMIPPSIPWATAKSWIHTAWMSIRSPSASPTDQRPPKEEERNAEKKNYEATPSERAMGMVPPSSPWAMVKTWIHACWMSLRKPSTQSGRESSVNPGEAMRDAVVQTTEGTLEGAESSAALATGEIKKTADALHVASDKLKSSLPGSQNDRDKEKGRDEEL